jgi:glutathione S-transferase
VDEADAAHLRAQIEGACKQSLEQLAGEREQALRLFLRKLAPVRKALEQKKFLGGGEPTYADYILFGVLQWSRVTSLAQVLEPGDVVARWFDRVLDLYGGAGRRELSRAERMRETAA